MTDPQPDLFSDSVPVLTEEVPLDKLGDYLDAQKAAGRFVASLSWPRKPGAKCVLTSFPLPKKNRQHPTTEAGGPCPPMV